MPFPQGNGGRESRWRAVLNYNELEDIAVARCIKRLDAFYIECDFLIHECKMYEDNKASSVVILYAYSFIQIQMFEVFLLIFFSHFIVMLKFLKHKKIIAFINFL